MAWNETGKKYYETGTKKGMLYPQVEGKYPKGIFWSGLTAVTESPSGAEENPLYADDIKWLVMRSAEEYGFTIEAYMYPPEFMECDGSVEAAQGVILGQQKRQAFGFSFVTTYGNDTEGNEHGYKLHLIYNATAAPSERSYQTINDSPEAITFSWECSTTPVNVTGYKPVSCITIDSTTADPTKLKALEDMLYGEGSENPQLPDPDTVIEMMKVS